LERAGLIESRGRHGTRVTSPAAAAPTARAKEKRLTEAARLFTEVARAVGASERDMLQAIRKARAR
jgi:DNA-binding transcriptional regulator YhcF (GntR family)